jgi:hypothetical protein
MIPRARLSRAESFPGPAGYQAGKLSHGCQWPAAPGAGRHRRHRRRRSGFQVSGPETRTGRTEDHGVKKSICLQQAVSSTMRRLPALGICMVYLDCVIINYAQDFRGNAHVDTDTKFFSGQLQ